MITHEEIIEISKHYNLNINQSSTIERYVKQNQLREERAKKVEELLKMYELLAKYGRPYTKTLYEWVETRVLEKELEELK